MFLDAILCICVMVGEIGEFVSLRCIGRFVIPLTVIHIDMATSTGVIAVNTFKRLDNVIGVTSSAIGTLVERGTL